MIVLGIDPGVATVGFGVVERQGMRHIRHGVITTPAGRPLPERLQMLWEDLSRLLDLYRPQEMAVEELFFSKNITTGISVAHARGVILLAGQSRGIPIAEYGPMQVKQAVTSYGKADKQQMQQMTARILNLPKPPAPDDAADALAVAICHCFTVR